MTPIKHHTNNHTFGAPDDWDLQTPCETLGVTVVQEGKAVSLVSFWQPDEVERKAIAEGKPIILTIYGRQHPVVSVGVEA